PTSPTLPNHTSPPPPYTLSLHDALPICSRASSSTSTCQTPSGSAIRSRLSRRIVSGSINSPAFTSTRNDPLRAASFARSAAIRRSEEHTSELQSQSNLVCRLLLEKKKKK